jgi:RNase P/RNase MRP subunit p29
MIGAVIPKEYTVFELRIPLMDGKAGEPANVASDAPECLVFEIYGSQFAHRPAERITKKLKAHFPKDI